MALCSGHLSAMSRRARLYHGGLGLEVNLEAWNHSPSAHTRASCRWLLTTDSVFGGTIELDVYNELVEEL